MNNSIRKTSSLTLAYVAALALFAFASAAMAQQREPATAASTPAIPLISGLVIVNAVHESGVGDYEGIKRVGAVSADSVSFTASAELPDGRTFLVKRDMTREDLRQAHTYRPRFNTGDPAQYPGTTGLSVSAAVLNELRTAGQTQFSLVSADAASPLVGLLGGLLGGQGGSLGKNLEDALNESGTLKRVEPQPVGIPVLVNNFRVSLPAIHARGQLGDQQADFYILNDVANPLVLSWQRGATKSQVVGITFPIATTGRRIEETLNASGRAEIFGIYFDFAKDTIRPESEAVLKEIADVMANNPAWRLTIEGHTDNIGGASANVDLSNRRAASVKRALVDRYRVVASRFDTGGFGASRPKEANNTLEGRARNRRVELVRQ